MDPDTGHRDHLSDTVPNRDPPTKRPRRRIDDSVESTTLDGSKSTKRIRIDTTHLTTDSDPFEDDYDKDEKLFRDVPFDEPYTHNGGSDGNLDDVNVGDSDHSNNSDSFYSKIKAMEEKGRDCLGLTTTPPIDPKTINTNSIDQHQTSYMKPSNIDSSPTTTTSAKSRLIQVFIKLVNPNTNKVVLDTKEFIGDMDTVQTFLKASNVDVSITESSYFGDVSSEVSFPSVDLLTANTRLSKTSFGSSIQRPSDASTLSRPSVDSRLSIPVRKERGNNNLPLLSSTRIFDKNKESSSSSDNINIKGRLVSKPSLEKIEEISSAVAGVVPPIKELSTISNSTFVTSISSNTTKIESGSSSASGKRRRTKGQLERNGIATIKDIENFNDPSFVKSATLWGSIGPGAAVFGRWRDRVYYSGKIEKRGSNDTWSINFEDEMTDVASETHILPIKILGVGTWTVYCPSDVFKPEDALVTGQRFIDGTNDDLEKTEYALISDNDGRVIISNRKNLTLAESDAREMRKQYQVSITTKTADLSIGNIVEGKRDRCAKTEPPPSSQIRALVAKLDSSSKSMSFDGNSIVSKRQLDKSSTSTPTTSRTKLGQELKISKIVQKASECSNGERSINNSSDSDGDQPQTSPQPRKLSLADSDSTSGKDDDGDISQIFSGMHVFLTASGGMDLSTNGVGYEKEDLRRMIEGGGGIVLDGVGSEGRRRKNVFLISDNYARTVKYIYALAAGIPCLSYTWITESFITQRLLDYKPFELSAGFSIESELVLPAHREKPLKGFYVYVTGATDELYKYWQPVLHVAGAIIPKKPTIKKGQPGVLVPSQANVLVTDNSCPVEVWEYARERNIPIVRPEWLVQTIITGKRVAFTGHDKYSVTEVDSTMD